MTGTTETSSDTVRNTFGHRLRVRVCGLCFSGDDLLLVRHRGLGDKGYLYAPPGGEMHYGEGAEEALLREIAEETGLQVTVREFLFVYEYRALPLHAVELFFAVDLVAGTLRPGQDPELADGEQLIEYVGFMSPEAVAHERGGSMHDMINRCQLPKELLSWRGYFEFENKKRN